AIDRGQLADFFDGSAETGILRVFLIGRRVGLVSCDAAPELRHFCVAREENDGRIRLTREHCEAELLPFCFFDWRDGLNAQDQRWVDPVSCRPISMRRNGAVKIFFKLRTVRAWRA